MYKKYKWLVVGRTKQQCMSIRRLIALGLIRVAGAPLYDQRGGKVRGGSRRHAPERCRGAALQMQYKTDVAVFWTPRGVCDTAERLRYGLGFRVQSLGLFRLSASRRSSCA